MKTEYQKDASIGHKVHQHLYEMGLETPMVHHPELHKPRRAEIESHMAAIMAELNLDLKDDSLYETPKRIAKMFTQEIFYGLDYNNFPKATVVENKFKYDEMIRGHATVHSTCEHHFLPIIGEAFVAYIPNKDVVGLSKINRIVDFFCRRPQVQERLTAQIFETLKFILDTPHVAVVLEAEHMCVKTRGVMDACSDTITSQLGGDFRKPEVRQEFFALAKGLRR
ncbi:GTP cyclohydrolase I type 1 [Burkholderia phage BCSR5]|nr:GTP cyclohydrolase I type 1 [Burkholderia phage BCSR5]